MGKKLSGSKSEHTITVILDSHSYPGTLTVEAATHDWVHYDPEWDPYPEDEFERPHRPAVYVVAAVPGLGRWHMYVDEKNMGFAGRYASPEPALADAEQIAQLVRASLQQGLGVPSAKHQEADGGA